MKYPPETVIRWVDTENGKMSRKAAKREGWIPRTKKAKKSVRMHGVDIHSQVKREGL